MVQSLDTVLALIMGLRATVNWARRKPRAVCPAAAALASVFAAACTGGADSPAAPAATAPAAARFVGGSQCAACHESERDRWRGSQHDLAMQATGPGTVLGDFTGAEFTYNGVTSTFFMRDDAYWVRTDGADGVLADFKVAFAFGVDPLQQYLLELPDGRLQALSIAWDTRPASRGGQRWFHLYPGETVDSDDPLHWTGVFQSWNTMCAECHSTNVEKHYDVDADRFATTFSSVDVDCEACHGPGSLHAASPQEFPMVLGAVARAWTFADGAAIAARAGESVTRTEEEICAQCHARRAQLGDDYVAGDALLDAYRPVTLDAGLYEADGQILDEVYVYGSFLQSAMHAAGVTCSDCHDPHSLRLRAEGNALCAQCHLPAVFDDSSHHHHAAGPSTPACVDCHMRSKTYMVVDPRRDHSFRVPRPDLSDALGTPNACMDCHGEKTSAWAARAVAAWFPEGRGTKPHYGEALHAGRTWARDRGPLLRGTAVDTGVPGIVRATAVTLLAEQVDDAAMGVIAQALDDDDALVELAALDALLNLPVEMRVALAQRFLAHPRLALRASAARALAPARPLLSERRRRDLDSALADFVATQRFNGDRGQGLVNLGNLELALGRLEQAEAWFRQALAREPSLAAAYVNLADLYRQLDRETEAERVLGEGRRHLPDDPSLELALGLTLVRGGRTDEAMALLARAAQSDGVDPYYLYVFGIALNSTGETARALAVLRDGHERYPGYRELLLALATISRDTGDTAEALRYAGELLDLAPADATAQALAAELRAAAAAE